MIFLFYFFDRVQSPDVSQADMFRSNTVDSLVSPPGTHPAPSPPGQSQSPSQSNSDTGFTGRRCSLIQEESIEEDEETEFEEREVKCTRSLDDQLSDDSDNRNMDTSLSEQTAKTIKTPRKTAHVRPLHSVRSSPQLLNQIHEEGESDDDIIIPNKISVQPGTSGYNQRGIASASPELLQRVERRKKRLTAGNRGTSCSSSDASDTDETDQHKRKEKLKHRFHRRDSSDHSSDTDGPGAPPGGSSGGNNRPFGGSGNNDKNNRDRDHDGDNRKDRNNRDNSWRSNNGRSSGGGGGGKKQNAGHGVVVESDRQTDTKHKASNLSMASHLSNLSLTSLSSRSSKYQVDPVTHDPAVAKDTNNIDVDAMNEENKQRSHVIHVRSKDFTDLMHRFNKKDEKIESSSSSNKDSKNTAKPRRRSKDKMKMDINRNGIKSDMMDTTGNSETEAPSGGDAMLTPKTKCCRLI